MSKLNKLAGKLQTSVIAQTEQAVTRQKDKFARADEIIHGAADPVIQDTRLQTMPETGAGLSAKKTLPAQSMTALAGTTLVGTNVRQIPLALVLDHPRNARHIYDPVRVDEMASAIARDEQQVPAVVMPNPAPDKPGTYLLIDGRYRKKALNSLGRDYILASIIDPLSELEAYRLSLQLNVERNEQTVLDNALSWKAMLEDGIYTSQEHLADHLNVAQATISKILGVLDLPSSVLAVIRTKPSGFGVRVVQELRQLSKKLAEREVEAVAEQVRDEKLSVRDLERLRDRASREPVTRERSRAYPLEWDGKELGNLRDFDDGRLKIELVKAPDYLRNRIIEAVRQVLSDTPVKPTGR